MYLADEHIRLSGKCVKLEVRLGKSLTDAEEKELEISEVAFYQDDGFPLCNGYMLGKDDGKTSLRVHPCQAIGLEPEDWAWFSTFERIEK